MGSARRRAPSPGDLRLDDPALYAGGIPHDLYAELRAVTPDSLHPLLVDLFETITLWELRTEQATVQSAGTGEHSVTLDVVARKVRADSVGNETEVPMDDLVEIGVFATGEAAPIYLERHRIRSGAQEAPNRSPSTASGARASRASASTAAEGMECQSTRMA